MVETWFVLILAALSNFLGLAWLALAMTVHWRQVMQTQAAPGDATRGILQLLGVVGLLISAVLCFIADRPSMAVLVWFMLLAAAIPSIGMLLAWRPQWLCFIWIKKLQD